jgi:predicted  nucleic acid-binding Zn-ribbon protein
MPFTKEQYVSLREIARIDAALARIKADRKKLDTTVSQVEAEIQALTVRIAQAKTRGDAILAQVERARGEIAATRKKLHERRQGVTALGGAKIQQAALREIGADERSCDAHELKLLQEEDRYLTLEGEIPGLLLQQVELQRAYEEALAERTGTLETLAYREERLIKERIGFTATLTTSDLTAYDRVKERYPMDPLVAVEDGACSGCGSTLSPQHLVALKRGERMIQCVDCGRVLTDTQEDQPA